MISEMREEPQPLSWVLSASGETFKDVVYGHCLTVDRIFDLFEQTGEMKAKIAKQDSLWGICFIKVEGHQGREPDSLRSI